MFRGSHQTRVDEKGRVKLPADYKRLLAEEAEFYITSMDGERAQLYPMAQWEEVERIVGQSADAEAREQFMITTGYFGQTVRMDNQGRLLLPQVLRERAKLDGDVIVRGMVGRNDVRSLEVVRLEVFEPKVKPVSFAQLNALGL